MQTTCLVRTHLFNRWTNVRFDQRHQSPLVLCIVHGSWYGCHWIPCRLDTNRRTILISLLIDLKPMNLILNLALGFAVASNCFGSILERILRTMNCNAMYSINFNVHAKPKNQMNWSKALNIRRIRLCTIVLVWMYGCCQICVSDSLGPGVEYQRITYLQLSEEKVKWRTSTAVLSIQKSKFQRPIQLHNCKKKVRSALRQLFFPTIPLLVHRLFDNRFWVRPRGTEGFVIKAATAIVFSFGMCWVSVEHRWGLVATAPALAK